MKHPTDLLGRITAVHLSHATAAPIEPGDQLTQRCICGRWLTANTLESMTAAWATHVAQAVLLELDLELE
jgi:hypothetical protein